MHARVIAKDFMNVPGVANLELATTLAGAKPLVSEPIVQKFSTLICCMAASSLSRVFLLLPPSVPSIPTK